MRSAIADRSGWARRWRGAFLGLGLALGTGGGLGAQLVTLTPTVDTYLRAGSPNKVSGGEAVLRVQGSGDNRGLLRFDQATIAAAVGTGRLVTATLSLYVQSNGDNWGANGRTVDIHRMSADWTEAGATWNCAVDTQPSNSQPNCAVQWGGGTWDEESTDSVLHVDGLGGWVSYDVSGDVAAFLAGTANRGWLLKKSDESETGMVEYASREAPADRRPRLVFLVESAANDGVPPQLRITAPTDAVLVNTPAPAIALAYADGGAGVDLATLTVRVDQIDISSQCATTGTAATCTPAPLGAGAHVVTVSLADHAGNSTSAQATFELLLGVGPHTLTLPAAADTSLRGGERNHAFGSAVTLDVRHSGPRRALVRFDQATLASTLAGAELVAGTLELYLESNGNNWGANGRPVEARRLTAAWTEVGATWNCAADTLPTNSQPDCSSQWAGGSYTATPTSSVLHTKGLTGWVRFDVAADVRAFLAGTLNHGWLIRKADEGQSGQASYASREGTLGRAPRLVLVFATPVSDGEAPTISAPRPAEGGFVGNRRPLIAATLADQGTGVDATTIRLAVDGVDRTAEAVRETTGVSFTPGADLADGAHSVRVDVRDRAGNPAQAQWSFTVDGVAPVLAFEAPASRLVRPFPNFRLAVAIAESGSGIAPGSLAVTLDGNDVTAGCQVAPLRVDCESPTVTGGQHALMVAAADRAGNAASAALSFELVIDLQPPHVLLLGPADGAAVTTATVDVAGTVADESQIIALTVDGRPASLEEGGFLAVVGLLEGANAIDVVATDEVGRLGRASVVVFRDSEPPVLVVSSPRSGQLVNAETVEVVGEVTDASPVVVTIVGVGVAVEDGRFARTVSVQEGSNVLSVLATDRAGLQREQTLVVSRFTLPEVRIASPPDLFRATTTTIAVSGTVSDATARVTVNGVLAELAGTGFAASGVPLVEGGNTVTATVTDARGHVATDTIHVVRDLTPPRLHIDYPADGATLHEAAVDVRGLVNDIVPGTVNAGEAQVTVNGTPAEVVNRSFLARGVALLPGSNTLTAVAMDDSGNRSVASVAVERAGGVVARVVAVGGNAQTGAIGSPVPQPLVAEVRDRNGNPVAGKPVVFRVTRGDGRVDGRRLTASTTDAAGRAQVSFTLGTRTGVGVHVVEAAVAGIDGAAVFAASATPGPPALVVVDGGGTQVGVAGRDLPRPLIAAVVDAGGNRLSGVPVAFKVVDGGGGFLGGGAERTVTTDSDGRAITTFVLDGEEGIANNVVEASLAGVEGGPTAGFVASGLAAGPPEATSISGVVLDNTNLPVAGVTMRVRDTQLSAASDVNGQFRIAGAPVGAVKLIVDGSTASRSGAWPDLEYDLVTIAGRDTTVNMPIYVLPLDLQGGVMVDETRGATLTLPEVPGFALEIAPGSVTFPSGSRSGMVSVTAVHGDKVPMVPNFGQQPRFIVTIQPAGARFEPPARLTLPNVEGFPAGKVTEIYSFDHDLGHFVSIGPATVSEDGMTIVANPGVGIVKAGWHCGGDPPPNATTHNCTDCYQCIKNVCTPEKLCKACTPGNACDGGGHCRSGRDLIPKICKDIKLVTGEVQHGSCSGVPRLAGIPNLCGAAMRVVYDSVTHGCDHADLKGALWNEKLSLISSTCGNLGEPDTGTCEVVAGNKLAPSGMVCRDYYYMCRDKELWPMNFHCEEVWEQKIFIDDCELETHRIVFTVVNDAHGCLGFAERH